MEWARGAYCAGFRSFHDLQDLIEGQLADPTLDGQRVMLYLETLVGAEGPRFEHFGLRFGMAVTTSSLVVKDDLFDTHIDGYEAVIKLQWIAVEVLSHVGDGVGKESENGRRHLISWIC